MSVCTTFGVVRGQRSQWHILLPALNTDPPPMIQAAECGVEMLDIPH